MCAPCKTGQTSRVVRGICPYQASGGSYTYESALLYRLSKIMSDRAHDSVGTGILPVLYGQARRLSHQSVAELGISSPDTNGTKLLASAICGGPIVH
jgi:hypothetical protein